MNKAIKKAIDILEAHNKWRRDDQVPSDLPMQDPSEVGDAIDFLINIAKCHDDQN